MKNILILIVAAAVYLHFYPQPEVTKLYNETKETLLDGFAEFSDTKVRLKADKIYIDLEPELSKFSPNEVDLLKDITSSRASVVSFYQEFCQSDNRNAIFHPLNQVKVCKTIEKYRSMF